MMAGSGPRMVTALTVGLLAALIGVSAAEKPNVLVIMVDDMGYNDLGIQGSPDVKSPHIDLLMKDGVRFTDAYSLAGYCSPARAGFLGGIHPWQIGHHFNPAHDIEDATHGIPPSVTTMPQTLKKAGYATMMIGKHHLGFAEEHHPLKRGFDRFYGFLGGSFNYFQHRFWKAGMWEYIYDDWKIVDNSTITYLTDDFTDQAMDFMKTSKKAGKPWFVFLSYNAPHGPYEYKQEDLDPTVSEDRQPHVAMIKSIDENVGRLRAHITKLGLRKKTIIWFVNDNGGHKKGANNYPLRQYKGSLLEGGIRIPMSFTWPGTISREQTSSQLVSLLDIYPTNQAAAEIPEADQNPLLQGVNLLPFMVRKGETAPENTGDVRTFLFNRKGTRLGSVRMGPWKLIVAKNNKGEYKLGHNDSAMYNLDNDIKEKNNVIDDERPTANIMFDAFLEWESQEVKAAFKSTALPKNSAMNPVSVAITSGPVNVPRYQEVSFTAEASNSEGNKIYYWWEVFEKEDETFANYNQIKKTGGNKKRLRKQKKVFMTFNRLGEWVVRIEVRDELRWVKWADMVVNVYEPTPTPSPTPSPSPSPTTPSTSPTTPSTSPTTPSTSPTMPSTSPTMPSTSPTTPSTSPTAPSSDPMAPSTSPMAEPGDT